MNRSAPDLIELTGHFCDGTISPVQAERLEKLVADSAEARQYVLDTFQVHCELAWEFGRASGDPQLTSLGIAKGGGRAFAGVRPGGKTNDFASLSSPVNRRRRRWISLAVAASIVAAATLFAIFPSRQPRPEAPSRQESHPTTSQVARVEKINGVRWRQDAAAEIGRSLPSGTKLSIEQGLAQIRFESGAKIIVQGPADIELQSVNSATLRSGSLTADVPVQARGFEIHTPNANVVDLGTRFGIACEAGQTDVEVFAGNVLLRPNTAGANDPKELRLAAHDAERVRGTPGTGPLQVVPIAPGSRSFADSVDSCYPHTAPACACPDVPQAAAELIGPWHCPQGKLVSIDLSRQANWSRTQSTPDRVSNSLVGLDLGPRSLAGVEFKIDSRLIQLHGVGLPKQSRAVHGIPVGRRATRLYILQGAQFCGPDYGVHEGEFIAEYRIRYAGGDRATIPVVFGKDVRDWWAGGPNPVTRGQVVWVGLNPEAKHDKKYLRLYLCTWENPHPEKAIENIDFVSMSDSAGPFCVAMTAEELPSAQAPVPRENGSAH
jgi:hypothetical protein